MAEDSKIITSKTLTLMQITNKVNVKMLKVKVQTAVNPIKKIFKKSNCVVPISNLHSS